MPEVQVDGLTMFVGGLKVAEDRYLLRGGCLITLDRELGDFTRGGDVLIEGDRIAAVGPHIDAADCQVVDATGMLVIPGFVDTHRHTWQAQIRNIAGDWTLAEYLQGIRAELGPRYRPEDVYAGNLIGVLEGLDAGITTLVDWSHIMNSPEHADAAIAALTESGSRALFAYGTPNDAHTDEWHFESTIPHSEDVRRVKKTYFSSNDQLVTLAMAVRGPQFSTIDITDHDWKLARELELRMTVHVGDGAWGIKYRPIEQLNERHLLGADTTYVHCNTLPDNQLQLIADSGGTASIAPEVEMHMGHGFPATGRLLKVGIRPSISIDVCTDISADMFSAMRACLASERALANQVALNSGVPTGIVLTTRDVLEFATVEGARACGMLDKIGTITPGKQADIVLIRTTGLNLTPLNNPIAAVVLAAHPGDVDTVFVAGKPVKRGGRFVSIDVERARKLAIESRDYLFAQAGVSNLNAWHPNVAEIWNP
jgi:5-methylthioadenosine/S-adenosylhomocysteine deaminase